MIIGTNSTFFHQCPKEVAGEKDDDPVARLTPLGWSCIGRILPVKPQGPHTAVLEYAYPSAGFDPQLVAPKRRVAGRERAAFHRPGGNMPRAQPKPRGKLASWKSFGGGVSLYIFPTHFETEHAYLTEACPARGRRVQDSRLHFNGFV